MGRDRQFLYYDLTRFVRYGDIIKVIGKGYYHFAVFIGDGLVIESQKFRGPQVVSLLQSLDGRSAIIERGENPDYAQIYTRLTEVLSKREQYDLLMNNCEHVARYVLSGKKESKQVQGWIVAACVIGIIFIK